MALSPIEGALALAKAIPEFQQQQRVSPFMQALQDFSNRYASATTDAERQSLNAAANQTRQNFLQVGGSPYELDRRLWGSDPTQGFQTGAESYTPGYAADSMTNDQREKLAALTGLFASKPTFQRQATEAGLTGMYNGQPTWQRQAAEAELTGMFDGQKTWPRQYQENSLAIQQQNANKGSSSGGSKNTSGGAEDAYSFLKQLKNQGGTYETAMDKFYSNRTSFEEAGVSESEYKSMAKSIFPEEDDDLSASILGSGLSKALEEIESEGQETIRLYQRPFWQKLIDIVVPGGHYR